MSHKCLYICYFPETRPYSPTYLQIHGTTSLEGIYIKKAKRRKKKKMHLKLIILMYYLYA